MNKRVLQICSEVNIGSVGKIAESIGEVLIQNQWESYIAFGRDERPSKSKVIKIGNKIDILWHGFMTRIFDSHGLHSKSSTKKLVKKIDILSPDIIHLHHLHGYYINIEILFDYLSRKKIPVVWTFHDCWSFTGHCSHFEYINCTKWKTECNHCPQKLEYPKSFIMDRSRENFHLKKNIFNSLSNLTIVSPSKWLDSHVKESFLKKNESLVIHNGIDVTIFSPKEDFNGVKNKYNIMNDSFIILGVAGVWTEKKGLQFFNRLAEILPKEEFKIVLVGLSQKQSRNINRHIISILKTDNVEELASLYSLANVFVNPTLEDTYPTTNMEAISCGTPVITFRTGGSVESVNINTGFIVEKNDIDDLVIKIKKIRSVGKDKYTNECRQYALAHFNKDDKFYDYFNLYQKLLEK